MIDDSMVEEFAKGLIASPELQSLNLSGNKCTGRAIELLGIIEMNLLHF